MYWKERFDKNGSITLSSAMVDNVQPITQLRPLLNNGKGLHICTKDGVCWVSADEVVEYITWDGTVQWRRDVAADVDCHFSLAYGALPVASEKAFVFPEENGLACLSMRDGSLLWKAAECMATDIWERIQAEPDISPVAAFECILAIVDDDDIVYVANDYVVRQLSLTDGSIQGWIPLMAYASDMPGYITAFSYELPDGWRPDDLSWATEEDAEEKYGPYYMPDANDPCRDLRVFDQRTFQVLWESDSDAANKAGYRNRYPRANEQYFCFVHEEPDTDIALSLLTVDRSTGASKVVGLPDKYKHGLNVVLAGSTSYVSTATGVVLEIDLAAGTVVQSYDYADKLLMVNHGVGDMGVSAPLIGFKDGCLLFEKDGRILRKMNGEPAWTAIGTLDIGGDEVKRVTCVDEEGVVVVYTQAQWMAVRLS